MQLEAHTVDAPLPARYDAVIRRSVFSVLSDLTVGVAADMNRSAKRMRWYTAEFCREHPEWRFTVRRAAKPGWSRVWRVK
jgi:hypothetical protein